ncbi:zinc-binding alcohol dehydrogenase [Aureimonas sp. AU12]|uniref:zinc-dependent alcohol dehydrogenase n=1 Tax=Aureimonas sp. AU12 TaxID=1638161 RepID=UPI001FCD1826|nr:zinc-binding alcohol dehydrogenase [Aureimonas sp. AU12]
MRHPRSDEVLVRSRFGAVSRGTEALVFAGRVPASEGERMRAPFQGGSFAFPLKYGYAVVGEVAAGPPPLLGRTVFCLHPHQDRFVVPADAVHLVPDGVPASRAVLAANMETALNIVWDAGILPGDRVAVVGGGTVGLLAAWLASGVPGTDTVLVDIDPARRAVTERLGLAFALPGAADGERDCCLHVSGSPDGLASAIELAGFEARVVEASWYGTDLVPLALGAAFHARRLTIVSSQVGHVPAGRRARWTPSRRMASALALLADPRLDALVLGETAFVDLPGAYAGILASPATLCHRIVY